MRGESDIPFERTGGAGLTPAYAGRIGHATVYFVPRVDPRACGENTLRCFMRSSAKG